MKITNIGGGGVGERTYLDFIKLTDDPTPVERATWGRLRALFR